ncbi:MAG: acetyltransferase [Sphingopyxis sp.]|nr:MAG: acetyltransferase [Sphingopyxis sp.]
MKLTNIYIYHTLRNLLFFLYTRTFFHKNARIIKGFPRIINKGALTYGKGFTAGTDLRIEVLKKDASLKIGENVKINDYCHIGVCYSVVIGDNCLIGSRVSIVDHDHGIYSSKDNCSPPNTKPDLRPLHGSEVKIGTNTWIAENVVIVAGVTIGQGCVIGANSVVTSDIPDNSVAAGSPAKVIRQYDWEKRTWEK